MNRAGTGTRQQWLLVFNCQALGLANCLSLLSEEIVVSHFDPAAFREHRDHILPQLLGFDRILVAPGMTGKLGPHVAGLDNLWRLPSVHFGGYHPDICWLAGQGPLSAGPLGHYHSAIAYAAFRCGLDERETLALFNEETYNGLGYDARWEQDADNLVETYRSHGFDVRQAFVDWSREGPFMHTINHPSISCLHRLALVVLERAGIAPIESEHLPHDNLANGPAFPIYPEIASRLGLRGSYRFTAAGYRPMDLGQFIAESFAVYRANPGETASVPAFLPAIDNAMSFIRAVG